MAEKFVSKKETNTGSDSVAVKGESLYESDQKMATDAISLKSNETDRSNSVQRSHRNTGK